MSEPGEEFEPARIVRQLSSADEERRRLAVERLPELPFASAIARLAESLGDASWRVRKAAVECISALGESDPIVDALIAALADGDNPGRRNSAVEALVACGDRVVPALVAALTSEDADVRKFLVDAIAGIGSVAATGPMIERLADPDINVRAAAADALGVLPGGDSSAALRRLASQQGEDRLVRFSALHALVRLEVDVPVGELADVLDDPVLGPAGYSLLGYSEDAGAVDVLLKGLSSSLRSCREAGMGAVLGLLARVDGPAESALRERVREVAGHSELLISSAIDRLGDADLSSRLVLIQFMGLLGNERVVTAILEAGRDEAISEVAQAALESLGEVAERVIDVHWNELDIDGKCLACQLLGRGARKSGVARLLSALRDSNSELRAAAALALGERRAIDSLGELVAALEVAATAHDFGSDDEIAALERGIVLIAGGGEAGEADCVGSVLEPLASLLDDSEETLRLSIATVLSQICRPQDHELISLLQKDSSPQVRRVAVAGFERLAPETAVERLRLALADESPVVRIAAAMALGRAQQPGVIHDLKRLMEDEEQRVRAAAVRAVGVQGSRASDDDTRRECLLVITKAPSGDCVVAMAMIEALAAMGGTDAAQAGLPLLTRPEPELVQAAIACIGTHGDGGALAQLIPLVSNECWAVRADAIRTLGERRVMHALCVIRDRLELEQDAFVRDALASALRLLED